MKANANFSRMASDEFTNTAVRKGLLFKLLRYLKPYILHVTISLILLLCLVGIELIIPFITKTIIMDHIRSDKVLVILNSSEEGIELQKYYKAIDVYDFDNKHYALFSKTVLNKLPDEIRKKLKGENRIFADDYQKILLDDKSKLHGIEAIQIGENSYLIKSKILNSLDKKKRLELREQEFKRVKLFGLLFVAIIVLKFFVNYFQVYLASYASQNAMFTLRKDVFAHMEKMPLSFFDKNPVGRLVTRVANDVRTLDELLSNGLLKTVSDTLIIFAIAITMFIIDWRLALVTMSLIPIVFALIIYFKNKLRDVYRLIRKQVAALNAMLSEHITGVSIIQLFNQQEHKAKEFQSINLKHFGAALKQIKLFALFRPIVGVSRQLTFALILWYSGFHILEGTLTLGVFFIFTSYLDKFFEPLRGISDQFNIFQSAFSGAERLFDLLEQKPESYRSDKTKNLKLRGEIEFKNVWLAYYEEEWVLKDVSFKINPGEKVALVGHTGSGKTSIVSLIMGFYPYQKGEILLDGVNIKEYSLEDLRGNIGIVQQDVFLFSGTIRDNIVLDNDKMSQENLEQIAKYVNVHNFINSLPEKYDEPVMERGSTFSVGQRQLIAFARVLAYNPSIFILDEATSNIDTETEILIQDALEKITKERTSILIAHRLSTIQNCDKIIVLHKGKKMEEGNHQELLRLEGLYYNLYQLQYKK